MQAIRPLQHLPKRTILAVLIALSFPISGWAADAVPDAVMPTITVTSAGPSSVSGKTEGTQSYTSGSTRTATPLSTSLRDTPQSVTVVTRQRIDDQASYNITDVLNNVTGVSVQQYETNRAQFTARGFDINTLMIDGTPTTWDQAWSSGEIATSLAIYDRVEVVRGATGLTSGTGNPSAAINLVRKRASAKELEGKVEVGIGRWNERRVMADVATPLNQSGSLRGRFVAEHYEQDSWVDRLSNRNQTMLASFEVDLGANTLLSGGFSRQDGKSRGAMWGGLPVWYSDGTATNWDRSKSTAADWVRWDSESETYFASLEHNFSNDWRLKASYNHTERESDSYLYYMFGAPDRATGLGLFTFPGSYLVNTRQEDVGVEVAGPFALWGRKHELAFGYVHSQQKFGADSRNAVGGSAPDFNTYTGAVPEPAWSPLTFYQADKTTQEAAYGVARLRVADPLQVILGARVTQYTRSGTSALQPAPYQLKTGSEVTPYAGVVYDINESYSAYASYTDIFLPQQQRDINAAYLPPVEGKSSEIGIKGEFFEGRLNASASLFRIRQDNLAQATGVTIAGTVPPETAYAASKGATSEGFELDLAGELAKGWNASVGITKFRIKDANGVGINTHYPREMLRVFTTYRLPGEWNVLTIGGGVNWQGKTYTEALNPSGATQRIQQKSFALVNLMARYDVNKQLSAQLNINNLFDKKFYNVFDAFDQMTYGEPRSVSVALNYKF